MVKMGVLASALLVGGSAVASPAVIFGTIETEDGKTYTGAISWDGEEAYWVQHFNGRNADPFDLSDFDSETRDEILGEQPGPQIELGSTTIELVKWFSKPELRPTEIAVEFGAIERMDLSRGRVVVTLRDGSEMTSDGGSNDIGADILVMGADGAERDLDWDEIESIVFSEAPAGHPLWPDQLFGTVTTVHGTFDGIMAWDSDERFADEELDGDLPDGEELSIEFGDLVSIESLGDASRVVTHQGLDVVLNNSNDVDDENRGLMLVNPTFGRVDVDWADFNRVDFAPIPEGFLPGRSAWDDLGKLRGSVTVDGDSRSGEIIYDVDEQRSVDILDGVLGNSRAYVPFHRIASIERGAGQSTVVLRDGTTWTLSRQRDVSDSNSGIVVKAGDRREYFRWENVSSIRFDAP